MTELSQGQVEEVIARYSARDCLKVTIRILKKSPSDRARLWRAHYRPKKMGGGAILLASELKVRDATDAVLEFASILEVIAIACDETPSLPNEVKDQLLAILADPAAIKYYEEYYPMALPILLRQRLLGKLPASYLQAIRRDHGNGSVPTMPQLVSLLELDARRLKSKDLALFLALLDDKILGDVHLADVLELFRDPETYRRHLQKGKSTKVERLALLGLDEFMEFAADYERLLARLTKHPVLGSAFWLHNCYWFGAGGGSIQFTAKRLQTHLRNWSKSIDDSKVRGLFLGRVTATVTTLSNLAKWKAHAKPLLSVASTELRVWRAATGAEVARKAKRQTGRISHR